MDREGTYGFVHFAKVGRKWLFDNVETSDERLGDVPAGTKKIKFMCNRGDVERMTPPSAGLKAFAHAGGFEFRPCWTF
jgi:hypothetical protein